MVAFLEEEREAARERLKQKIFEASLANIEGENESTFKDSKKSSYNVNH